MTIQELKNGKPFKYDTKVYRLEEITSNSWIISHSSILGMFAYTASIKTIGRKRIEYYTWILGKRVSGVINIKDCMEVDE